MKVIDLLNTIANGEEVPKKIIFEDITYEYEDGVDYKNGTGLDKTFLMEAICTCEEDLNKEIKIIEDNIQELDIDKYTGVEDLVEKINELIDEVNKLKELK